MTMACLFKKVNFDFIYLNGINNGTKLKIVMHTVMICFWCSNIAGEYQKRHKNRNQPYSYSCHHEL